MQPSELENPRQVVLLAPPTGGCCGNGALQGDGEMLRERSRKTQLVATRVK